MLSTAGYLAPYARKPRPKVGGTRRSAESHDEIIRHVSIAGRSIDFVNVGRVLAAAGTTDLYFAGGSARLS